MLKPRYIPKEVEEGKYRKWKESLYFQGGLDKSKPPFSLVIPPPNVTGKLHLGHVMDTIPDDIIVRYKKMKGYDVTWVPGMDHAGIATQAKVEEKLREQGISRYDLGREGFLEKAWEWKQEYAETIHKQWEKLGLAVDYSRERFTLDEGLSKAVKHVFVTLYNEGLIYQGERIINWDPELKTALSNIEVEHQDDKGEFFYFVYDVEGMEKPLIVATTRPETMFGDTAVFVNPDDERYENYIGKKAINPANGEPLPIMADRYVDFSFGTGVMKCTPAHDPNDYALSKKYKLPIVRCLDEEAKMLPIAKGYEGLDRYECRAKLVEDIKSRGKLDHIEKITHSVGHSERSGCVVEPMLSKQWFVKMKPLAEKLIETQRKGEGVTFIPRRFERTLLRWMEEVDDWCISRQLWWGHRIPAYYHKKTGKLLVSEREPDLNEYVQDEDVLDTWFSSALWPFSTLGWPNEESEDFQRYFPTSVLVTGYDIIFFWVSRMYFQSLHFTGKAPFKDVVIHGLIRDEKGRKMSKSLGNGIDPIEVINKHGVDALRYFITTNSTPGQDMRYSEQKIIAAGNYLNKIWNAARFVEMNLGDKFVPEEIDFDSLPVLEQFILSRLEETIKKVAAKMEKYEFGAASSILYDFVYDDFCGFYLEMSKVSLLNPETAPMAKQVLYKVVRDIVLMIYPYTPFVAEEIYLSLPNGKESIMIEDYPIYESRYCHLPALKKGLLLRDIIKDVRNYKSVNKIAPNAPVKIAVLGSPSFKWMLPFLDRFLFARSRMVKSESEGTPFIYGSLTLYIEEDIDPRQLRLKLLAKKDILEKEIERSKRMLDNESFIAKAPAQKIAEERRKLEENTTSLQETIRELREVEARI